MTRMPRVLIVDDEPHICTILSAHLKPKYEVYTASDGSMAFEILAKKPIDLMIVDFNMPTIKGIEVIVESRKLAPNIKSIAMSGTSESDIFFKAARLFGASATIHKPFELNDLSNIIERILLSGPSVHSQN